MNVWKIASRWSGKGTKESSVLDLFRKYGLVFAGRETDKIKEKVNPGDLIAISDGLKIVSVAKVISAPVSITSFTIQEEDKTRFDYNAWVVGFKVEIFNLNQDEIFTTKMGTFHGMGKYSSQVEELFNNKTSLNTDFKIDTYTYNIFDSSPNSKSLIQQGIKYIVPVYQRPYSWSEKQIETFINDIFISFWGNDKTSPSESMFIGTMQLSDKKYSDEKSYYQEVIDGQQRITTITLLLKLLQKNHPDNTTVSNLDFTWIDTDVNRGQQSKDLKEVLFAHVFDNELNKYATNYKLLETYVEQNIIKDNDGVEFEANRFVNHLLTNLYFVVIETRAGLSKTLQIFNAINTTGLDLDSTDVFKIRLYEYLSKNGDNNDVFESIDKLYEKIDINNNNANKRVSNMNAILSIYKNILVSKHKLNMALWKMGTGAFFERLFDTLLNIKSWDGFSGLKGKDDIIDVNEINAIIDVRYFWEKKHYGKKGDFVSFHDMLSLRLLWWSRYYKYWTIPFIYLLREDAVDSKYYRLIQELSKLYTTYTLMYQKQVNEMHSFTKEIAQKLADKESVDVIIHEIETKYLEQRKKFENGINGDIFNNSKAKNILPRICASVDEFKKGIPIKTIEALVFDTKEIDIEHIKSRNDKEFEKVETKEEWHPLLNSIGNLMVLEFSINRSIGNNDFCDKVIEYKKSRFSTAKDLSTLYPSWGFNEANKRRATEVGKITEYMYKYKDWEVMNAEPY